MTTWAEQFAATNPVNKKIIATTKITDDKKVKQTLTCECDVDENGWCDIHNGYMSNCPVYPSKH